MVLVSYFWGDTMNATRFILILLTVYLSLLTTIFAVFRVKKYFIGELIIFAFLAIFGLVVLAKQYLGRKNASAVSTLFFSIVLLNTLFLYLTPAAESLQPQVLYVMLVSALFGLLFSLVRQDRNQREYEDNPEINQGVGHIADEMPQVMSEVYDIIEDSKKYEGSDKESHKSTGKLKKPAAAVSKSMKQSGKFVASSIGRKYHLAECDLAKKIIKKNIIWFKTKSEAEEHQYKPCNCVKK